MKSRGHRFLVACETDKGRYFRSFKDARTYYKAIKHYNHCHEMIIEDSGGRIVFDFDIKTKIPDEKMFKRKIEQLIRRTMKHYDSNIDVGMFQYVWLHSPNEEKISKHLIVKHGYFVRYWARQLKQFYKLFKQEYEKDPFNWITVDELIDHQVARKNGSMRMPLNSKLSGSKMLFDEPKKFNFFDGLIQPIEPALEQKIPLFDIPIKINPVQFVETIHDTVPPSLVPDGYKIGDRKGNIIQLLRTKPSKCPISSKIHDSDNACIILSGNSILFYCYRERECLCLQDDTNEKVNETYEELKNLF